MAQYWPTGAPVPDGAAAFNGTVYNPKNDKTSKLSPSMTFVYRDADKRLLGYVVRIEIDGKKLTLQVTYHDDGRWHLKHFEAPRPLYGLPALATRTSDTVIVVEGEKTACAAQSLLEGFVVITWPGGTSAVERVDWTPLAGRQVTLWPDADKPGKQGIRGPLEREQPNQMAPLGADSPGHPHLLLTRRRQKHEHEEDQ